MTCEDKQSAFQDRLASEQEALAAELNAITADTERRAAEIAEEFERENDLADGLGAAAGAVVGAVVGGPGGAPVGGVIGRQIGALFTLEVGTRRETVVLDVPQVAMRTQDFSFDLPAVVVRDTDISFDLPTIEMRRQRGPDVPEVRVRMEQRCVDLPWPLGRACTDVPVTYLEMVPTYFDMPVTVMRTTRIVIGLPTVEMRRQEFKMDVPEFTMAPVEFSADIPYVTLRFIQDAGRRTAAQAAALAQSAQDAATQKQIAFKERLRLAVAPPAVEMFNCFRGTIADGRAEAAARFAPEVEKLSGAVSALLSRGVPQTDETFLKAKAAMDDAIARRDAALRSFDDALDKLNASAKAALEQFLGTSAGVKGGKAMGGLSKFTPATAAKGATASAVSHGLISYQRPAEAKQLRRA
ncbi:MAG: hypothetical protein NDI84_04785 [Steroidobacteraceae bacterium]|nr:hypothetical protein [Steroidobacteraceae bacterium]